MKLLKFPQSWHDLNTAVDAGTVKLVAAPAALTKYLIFTYAISTGCFVGLCLYYNLLTTNDFVVSDEYNLSGYTCRPLQKDPEYELKITYDECMSTHYVAPTVSNVILYGHYGPFYYDFYNTTIGRLDLVKHNEGPWNFSFNMNKLASEETATVYHKPFPKLTNQTFTYNRVCKVPYYKDFDASHPLWTGDILDYPLDHATQFSTLSSSGNGNGYGYYGLCNTNINVAVDFDWDGTDLVFTPDANSNFVSQCGGNFTTSMQDMVDANGTYIFPHAYSADSGLWINCTWGDAFCGQDDPELVSIGLRLRSIGMTTLYPDANCKNKGHHHCGQSNHTRAGVGFSYDRCPYYEKEVSRQAFEYVYGTENCHPCDSFKFNSPFYCEKEVRKEVAEVIALAVSNSMAVLSLFIAAAPIVLLKFKAAEDEESVPKS